MSQPLNDLQWVDLAIRSRWCDEDIAVWERVCDKLEELAKTAHNKPSDEITPCYDCTNVGSCVCEACVSWSEFNLRPAA